MYEKPHGSSHDLARLRAVTVSVEDRTESSETLTRLDIENPSI
jgi:hypothetical protein